MEARPTGSGRERSSPNRCDQCRGQARHLSSSAQAAWRPAEAWASAPGLARIRRVASRDVRARRGTCRVQSLTSRAVSLLARRRRRIALYTSPAGICSELQAPIASGHACRHEPSARPRGGHPRGRPMPTDDARPHGPTTLQGSTDRRQPFATGAAQAYGRRRQLSRAARDVALAWRGKRRLRHRAGSLRLASASLSPRRTDGVAPSLAQRASRVLARHRRGCASSRRSVRA